MFPDEECVWFERREKLHRCECSEELCTCSLVRSVCGLKEGKAPSLRVFRGAVYMFPDEECVWFERGESSIAASVQRSCVHVP